jgi:hypothetical protein
MAGVGDLVQRTGDGQTQVGYSVAGRSGSRVTPCTVCAVHKEMSSVGFLVEPQNQGRRFPDLGLETGSSGLVIWASKSPRRFLGLGLKTKQDTICRLRNKTNGRMIRRGPRVEIWRLASPESKSHEGSPVWPQDWWRRDCGWCTWHYHGDRVELKLKTDGSMRWAVSDPSTLKSPFLVY